MSFINFPLQPPATPATPPTPGTAKPAVPAPQPASPATPATPASPADSAAPAPAQGKATPSVSFQSDQNPAIKQWKAAASQGTRIELASNPDSKIGKLLSLRDYVMLGPFSPEQKQKFAEFSHQFEELSSSDRRSPDQRMHALQLLNDRLESKGISSAQLDMILDGRFTAKDLVEMINDGVVI